MPRREKRERAMAKIYKSMLELIGKTPLLELGALGAKRREKARILAKL